MESGKYRRVVGLSEAVFTLAGSLVGVWLLRTAVRSLQVIL
jgi:hypothetical protein